MTPITIHTDGACQRNPGGKGGYGIVLQCGAIRKELSAGFRSTTNNRMELMAAIIAIEALKKEGMSVKLYSDSKYVVDGASSWIIGWQRKNFAGVKNADLWQRLLAAKNRHQVAFVWVRGHNGNQDNERCDELAVAACRSYDLLVDEGYEGVVKTAANHLVMQDQ